MGFCTFRYRVCKNKTKIFFSFFAGNYFYHIFVADNF